MPDLKNIVLFGSSEHARVVADIVECMGKYQICGIIDSYKEPGACFGGYDIIGSETNLLELQKTYSFDCGIICIGHNFMRQDFARRILNLNPKFHFINAIHPSAVVARSATLAGGVVVAAGAIINPGAQIREHVLVNTKASVDHDCVLEACSSVGPGAVLGGCVKLGALGAIGIGATVIHGVNIGSNVVVGAGAVVIRELEPNQVVVGVPAQKIKDRSESTPYL
jgi:sugar O-acyltransferase (sialic acid O-acetyltransferase NeuD family)